MKTLYVTVTVDCEDLANHTFPRGSEWEMIDEDYNDNGTSVIRYEWNGEMQSIVEQNLNTNRGVVSYQII